MTRSNNALSWKRYLSLRYLANKVREKGILWCLKTGTIKFFRGILIILLSPILYLLAPILYLLGVKFLPIVHLYSIGHLAVEPDCYIKEGFLGIHPHYLTIILAPADRLANRYLLEYWRKYIRIVTSPTLCSLLYPLSQRQILQYDITKYAMNTQETALAYEINTKWAGKPPLLSLRESDRRRGWDCLRRLGLLEGAWFVCVHGRALASKHRGLADTHRDVDIYTYFLAMEAIVERGGWCIRVGDPSMKPLPPMKNVIDYAHHSVRSDWMDVFLFASCRFFLGCNSGPQNVASVFGVPCALANLVPMSVLPNKHTDIGIPKLMWSCSEGRYLTFKEVLDFPIGNFHRSDLYANSGIKVVDNSPEEIRDLAIEMLDLTEGTMTYTVEDERLREQFESLLKPGHYSYGASSRIGRDFLRKYVRLLPDLDKTTG